MNLLQPYLSDAIVQSLGWTFIHSLWIVALISVLFLCVKWMLKGYSAQLKYVTGLVFLMVIPLTLSLVFVFTFQKIAYVDAAVVIDTSVIREAVDPELKLTELSFLANDPYYFQGISEAKDYYFYQYHSVLVAIWIIGVVLFSAQNIGGYFSVGKLRREGLFEPSKELKSAFDLLLNSSGIKRSVTLMESILVKAPVLIGHFKPVILLPIGLATSLSMGELEAILAHELAHIRRHDFLINIIQSCIEVVFFYHPGIWLLGSAIRAERENCCDDMAIGLSGSRLSLALALTRVEEWKHLNKMALGFSGNNNSLLNRIKRIINNETMKTQHTEGNLLATAIIAGLCLSTLTALKSIDYPQIQEGKEQTEQVVPVSDDLGEPKEVTSVKAVDKTKQESAQVPDKKLRSDVPAKPVADTLVKVRPTFPVAPIVREAADTRQESVFPAPVVPVEPVSVNVMPIVAAYPAVRWKTEMADNTFKGRLSKIDTSDWKSKVPELEQEFVEQMRSMAVEMAAMQGHLAAEIADRAVEMEKAAQFMAEHHQEMAVEMAESQEKMAKEMVVRHKEMAEAHQRMAMEFNESHQKEMMMRQKEMLQHQKEMAEEQRKMMKNQEDEMRQMEVEMRKNEEKMNTFSKDLRAELISDGLISRQDEHFKMKINARELTVNGEKQDENVYDKYRKFIQERLGGSKIIDGEDKGEMNMTFSY